MTEPSQHDRVESSERARVQAPELSWALRELNRAAAQVDHALAQRTGLRALDYAALGHVLEHPDALGPVELSARLGISTGSGTELVDRLERAGHLERHAHPSDRRRRTLRATDHAITQMLGNLAPLFAEIDALAGQFDPEEQEAIARYLRNAAKRMRDYAEEAL